MTVLKSSTSSNRRMRFGGRTMTVCPAGTPVQDTRKRPSSALSRTATPNRAMHASDSAFSSSNRRDEHVCVSHRVESDGDERVENLCLTYCRGLACTGVMQSSQREPVNLKLQPARQCGIALPQLRDDCRPVMTMTASLSLCEARFFLVWAICRPWMRKFMRKS